jgi:hypothetical protein
MNLKNGILSSSKLLNLWSVASEKLSFLSPERLTSVAFQDSDVAESIIHIFEGSIGDDIVTAKNLPSGETDED